MLDIGEKQVTCDSKGSCDLRISIEDDDFLLVGKHEKSLKELLSEVSLNLFLTML